MQTGKIGTQIRITFAKRTQIKIWKRIWKGIDYAQLLYTATGYENDSKIDEKQKKQKIAQRATKCNEMVARELGNGGWRAQKLLPH